MSMDRGWNVSQSPGKVCLQTRPGFPACSSAQLFLLYRWRRSGGFQQLLQEQAREPGRPLGPGCAPVASGAFFAPPPGDGNPDPPLLAGTAQARPFRPPLGVSDVALEC